MKISVIIPAYNAEAYIARAIGSCLTQTYPPHEIIVIDDASKDGTVAVAESFPSPVRVIRQEENTGVSEARNRAVRASTGDWVAFLDADDWFLPEKLESQERCALSTENPVLIYTAHRAVSKSGLEFGAQFVPPEDLGLQLRYRCPFHTSTVLLRRDAFDSVGGFDRSLSVAEDWDLWLRVAARYSVKAFAAVPEELVVYRYVAGSLSSNGLRFFKACTAVIENRSLYGTSGLYRLLLRRKIHAFNYYSTSMVLREERSPLDLSFILKSLALWPFTGNLMPLKRYKVALVILKQHLQRRLAS